MAITIKDVADAAGVSTATVSRALRGLPNVDAATRERIQRVAAELDYVISPSASRLASGRTGSVAVITPYIARWFFSTVLSGVESVLQSAGLDLLLMSVSTPDGQHRLPPAPRLRRRVDGVVQRCCSHCRHTADDGDGLPSRDHGARTRGRDCLCQRRR